MRELTRHLMMTVRSLVRQPAVTVPAVLTLALGIGANTALFAYLSALVWPRLEIREAKRVVRVYSGTAEDSRQQTQFPDYSEMARRQTAVPKLVAYTPFGTSVGLPEQTTFAWGWAVSGGYFAPGVSREQAQAAFDQLARTLDEVDPLGEGKRRFVLGPRPWPSWRSWRATCRHDEPRGSIRRPCSATCDVGK